MKLKLPANVLSPQDLDELILEVRQYANWHSHNAIKQQAQAKQLQPPTLSRNTQEMIHSWHSHKTPTSKSLDELIVKLTAFKNSARTIVITLAAPAGPKLKAQLANWCRKHLEADVLVDFNFDSTLLGGMIVRLGSHIYDWSFRRQILQNSHRFPEVLAHV